ncbi:MAG: ABC transporter permease [Bacteroidales bacterium]|nr:ABC transporter permease [Bacteroidales bacterium]
MGKLKYIIAREYTTRVRKKAFIVMTILGPVLFAALMIAPAWIAQVEDNDLKEIAVIEIDNIGKPVPDSLMILKGVFENSKQLKFTFLGSTTYSQAEGIVRNTGYYAALIVRHNVLLSGDKVSVEVLSKKQLSYGVEAQIRSALETYIYNRKLVAYNVTADILKSLNTKVYVVTTKIDSEGAKGQGNINIKRGVGYFSGFLVYIFIFFFGAQVMRGVVEEKSNRILEVIITSVKPFQLMMGKIIGIGMVGLTQFLIWVVLSLFIFFGAEAFMVNRKMASLQTQQQPTELFQSKSLPAQNTAPPIEEIDVSAFMKDIYEIDFFVVIGAFLFYFIGGYLLYAAMFAAIGAAVDSETDTQQFMLPVTIPLIVSIIVMMNAITNPEGQLAFWFSIIPFTSPIVMMARIGFEIPWHQLVLSTALLIATFIFMTWFAGKIYRTGILMYGKKTGYKEIIKWMRYR